jgi:hypothetical protein
MTSVRGMSPTPNQIDGSWRGGIGSAGIRKGEDMPASVVLPRPLQSLEARLLKVAPDCFFLVTILGRAN